MKVFKFGGASIKDISSIKNILKIISTYNEDRLVIVVSAMGKTTNALELVVHNYFNNKENLQASISEVYNFHSEIINNLFEKSHPIFCRLKYIIECTAALIQVDSIEQCSDI